MSQARNQQVCGQPNYARAAPIFHLEAVIAEWVDKLDQAELEDLMDTAKQSHEMRMLIVAMDSPGSSGPLTCTIEARSVEEFAKMCGANQVMSLYDEQCSKEAVLEAIRRIGSECGPDDIFIIYYVGRGLVGKEMTAKEACALTVEGADRATPGGSLHEREFSRAILDSVQADTRVLIVTDLCYQGTIVDLTHEDWLGREVVVISGSHNARSVGDTSRGGIFTHCMLLAVNRLSSVGINQYSVGLLYNAALFENVKIFGGKQDITIQTPVGFTPDLMAWPLVPPTGFPAPLNRLHILGDTARRISPLVLPHIKVGSLSEPVNPTDYISYVYGHGTGQFSQHRACHDCTGSSSCSLQ